MAVDAFVTPGSDEILTTPALTPVVALGRERTETIAIAIWKTNRLFSGKEVNTGIWIDYVSVSDKHTSASVGSSIVGGHASLAILSGEIRTAHALAVVIAERPDGTEKVTIAVWKSNFPKIEMNANYTLLLLHGALGQVRFVGVPWHPCIPRWYPPTHLSHFIPVKFGRQTHWPRRSQWGPREPNLLHKHSEI